MPPMKNAVSTTVILDFSSGHHQFRAFQKVISEGKEP